LAAAYVGISPATLRRLSDKGDAPKPLQLSPGRVAWRRADLDAWLDAKAGLIPASSGKSAWDG
jgi:prophage regulatory protein